MDKDYLLIAEQSDLNSMQDIAAQLQAIEPSSGFTFDMLGIAQSSVDMNTMLIMATITLALVAAASLAGVMTFSLFVKD